ncbi:MAG: hypothetical protein P1V18_04030 [Candidatus Gracilibacteria bacterium]|nr:hypothetical protein [Candidatus Gracilibacteria bacterium]
MTSRLIATFTILSLLIIPQVFAQEVRLTAPQTVTEGQEMTLSVQILNASGSPVTDGNPFISFTPNSAADEVSLFNCVDVGDKDNCQPNNRDVEGFYESVLQINQLPVVVKVEAEGTSSQITLDSSGAAATPVTPQAPTGAGTVTVQPTAVATPSSVQVGPTPSFWFVIAPFLMMAFAVTFFVAKTD